VLKAKAKAGMRHCELARNRQERLAAEEILPSGWRIRINSNLEISG
jgi:hypothetical protein